MDILNRRQFMKCIGAGAAIAVLPTAGLAAVENSVAKSKSHIARHYLTVETCGEASRQSMTMQIKAETLYGGQMINVGDTVMIANRERTQKARVTAYERVY